MTGIFASVDAGWQKRGTGRNYNSRSGHNTLIGHKTGLVLDYEVLQSGCYNCIKANKFCERTDCSKNYDGSAKSMEAASATRMVSSSSILRSAKAKVIKLATDEDATTHAALKRALRGDVCEKLLDRTHGIRIYKRDLFDIPLEATLIVSFAKCASTAMYACNGDADKLKKDILNMPSHAEGNHEHCGLWCKGKEKGSAYKHKNLEV
jgi:hypothetical protein